MNRHLRIAIVPLVILLGEFFDHYLKGAPRPEWMDRGVPAERGKRDVRPLCGEKPIVEAGNKDN